MGCNYSADRIRHHCGYESGSRKKYEKYTNVKVIAKEKNSGLSDTRNVGIKESCGQYIMFLDSDDYVENGCIAKIQRYN